MDSQSCDGNSYLYKNALITFFFACCPIHLTFLSPADILSYCNYILYKQKNFIMLPTLH